MGAHLTGEEQETLMDRLRHELVRRAVHQGRTTTSMFRQGAFKHHKKQKLQLMLKQVRRLFQLYRNGDGRLLRKNYET
jgi:hypothetical protein